MTAPRFDSLLMVAPLRHELHRRMFRQFEQGNFTADEIADLLGIHPLTSRPRCAELVKKGHLEDSGERRRNRISGKNATVWRIKKDGQQFLPLTA